jgi:DNA-binding NarL/FixJ family response regulator
VLMTANISIDGKQNDLHGAACAGGFSPRQMDILRQLWHGHQNSKIAHDLQISENTVKVHVQQIMKKLNARNRTQVVVFTISLRERDLAPVAD